MTALYNIIKAYSNWLYRDLGELDESLNPRTLKNCAIRSYLILVCLIVVRPAMLVEWCFNFCAVKYTVWRGTKALSRLIRDPNSKREDFYKAIKGGINNEDAEKLADECAELHRWIYRGE